jgi:DNA-binding XRE family transcriptional regulator
MRSFQACIRVEIEASIASVASELARSIRSRRKELDLTQQQVADQIGAPDCTVVCRWEKGTVDPPIERASGIANFLDVPLSEALRLIHRARLDRSNKKRAA